MTAADLLTGLHRRGVHLEPDGTVLRYRAPVGTLTDGDREALRQHRDALVALLVAEATGTAAEHLRTAGDGQERARLEQEAADGDGLTQLVVAALAEPETAVPPAALTDTATTIAQALRGAGSIIVYSSVLDAEVVFVRDVDVAMPEAHAILPRFDGDELAVLAEQHPEAERLQAICDVKRKMHGSRVVRDSGAGLIPAREVFPITTNATTTKATEAERRSRR